MELTFQSVFTRTHEVRPIISSLPADSAVRDSLLEAWSRPASYILHDYTSIMYIGLNSSTGENNNRKMKIIFIQIDFIFQDWCLLNTSAVGAMRWKNRFPLPKCSWK